MATRKRSPYPEKHVLSESEKKAREAAILIARSDFNAASFARLPGVDIDRIHRKVKQ